MDGHERWVFLSICGDSARLFDHNRDSLSSLITKINLQRGRLSHETGFYREIPGCQVSAGKVTGIYNIHPLVQNKEIPGFLLPPQSALFCSEIVLAKTLWWQNEA